MRGPKIGFEHTVCFTFAQVSSGGSLLVRPGASGVNPSKRPQLRQQTRLLRNSTIFRCAKNWDSDSARRKPLKRRGSLSCGPIVHSAQSEPNRPLTTRNSIPGLFAKRRSMPVGVPEKIGPRLAHSPHSGAFCEDCTSPNFCAAKIVEFRSSRMRGMRCGLFGRPDRHRPGSEAKTRS